MNSTTTCSYGGPTIGTFSGPPDYGGENGFLEFYTGNGLQDIQLQGNGGGYEFRAGAPAWATSTCVTTQGEAGGSYILDVGSTVMLGGILMFFIAYWYVGLIRTKKWNI